MRDMQSTLSLFRICLIYSIIQEHKYVRFFFSYDTKITLKWHFKHEKVKILPYICTISMAVITG